MVLFLVVAYQNHIYCEELRYLTLLVPLRVNHSSPIGLYEHLDTNFPPKTASLNTIAWQRDSNIKHMMAIHKLLHSCLASPTFPDTVAPITWTRIHVLVPLVSQSIHVHWEEELKSFLTIYDTYILINIGMLYTVGKHSNSTFQCSYLSKSEICVPLIFGNGRPCLISKYLLLKYEVAS